MPEDSDEHLRQHAAMLQDVPRMLAMQHTIEHIDRTLEGIHHTLGSVEMTQARMKTLVARVFIGKRTARTRRRRR